MLVVLIPGKTGHWRTQNDENLFLPLSFIRRLLETIKKPIVLTPYFFLEVQGLLSACQSNL